MNITFLGTAAANAYPEAFCHCPRCVQARQLGGKSLRKRSAALINTDLLIDLGPDIMVAAMMHGCPLTNVRYCLQTHAHADHLDMSHLLSRSREYGTVGAPLLHFYASEATMRCAAQLLERDCDLFNAKHRERLNLAIHVVEAGQSFLAGPYQVMAFTANHDPTVESLLYAIQADGQTFFYGTDTAVLPEETWQTFHRRKLRFNSVTLDHTYGPEQPGSDHLSAHQVIEHAARMKEEGLLAEQARVLGTHIAHEGNPTYPELSDFAARHGYEIAYDGLVV